MIRRVDSGIWTAFLGLALCAGLQAHAASSYVFGVLPYKPPARIGASFAPAAQELSRVIGRTVRLQTSSTLGVYKERLNHGDFDIALIDPVNATRLVDARRYIPMLRRPSKPASVVVANDSGLRSPSDLRGKRIGLQPPGTPVDIFVQSALIEQVGMTIKTDYTVERLRPGACLHRLLLKTIDACATGGGAELRAFEDKMRVKLRAVLTTRSFPHMVFATHARVPAPDREAIRAAVLRWHADAEGRQILDSIGPDTAFQDYVDADFDVVREAISAWKEREQHFR